MTLVVSNVSSKIESGIPGFSHFHACRLNPDSLETYEDPRFTEISRQISLAYSEVPDADLKILANALKLPAEHIISVADLGLQGDCYLSTDERGGFILEATLLLTNAFCPKRGKMKSQLAQSLESMLSNLGVSQVIVRDMHEDISQRALSDMPDRLLAFKNSREQNDRDAFSESCKEAIREFAIYFVNVEQADLSDRRIGELAATSARAFVEFNAAWIKPESISKWKEYRAAAVSMNPAEFAAIKQNFDNFDSFLKTAEEFLTSGIPEDPDISRKFSGNHSPSNPVFISMQEAVLRFFSATQVDLSKASIST